jgi:hypothetical protein
MQGKTTLILVALLIPWVTPQASAQVYSVTPTYQASFQEWNTQLVGSSFKAWGVMAGVDRRGSRWSPHLWIQKYELGSICVGALPAGEDCRIKGWQFAIGPKIQFVGNDRIGVSFAPNVGVDSRSNSQFSGGAGLHVNVRAGSFRPQVMGGFQRIRGRNFGTVGVGISFEFMAQGRGN